MDLFCVEHIYRGHRISVRPLAEPDTGWLAKIWTVQGRPTHLNATATRLEGARLCLERAQETIDRFITYRDSHGQE